jgi:hypothetical protein
VGFPCFLLLLLLYKRKVDFYKKILLRIFWALGELWKGFGVFWVGECFDAFMVRCHF